MKPAADSSDDDGDTGADYDHGGHDGYDDEAADDGNAHAACEVDTRRV